MNLDNNDGATITFRGGLALTTTINTGFNAINGGTIEVCDENPCNPAAAGALVNTVTTTTATALNVANTNIGASDLTFRSISSNGGSAAGIVLNTTGSAGGLHVTGTGTAGSGGTIANKTGGDIASGGIAPGTWTGATVGTGIILNNTADVQLDRMQLNDFSNYGIYAIDVAGLSFTNSTISGTNGDTSNFDESTMFLRNCSGTITLTSVNISGGFDNDLFILYDSATPDTATYNVTSSTFHDLGTGHNALVNLMSTTAASSSSNVTFNFGSTSDAALGNNFNNSANQNPSPPPATQYFGDGILVTFGGPFQHTVNVDKNTFFELFQAMDMASDFSADVDYRIYDNTISFTEGVAAIAFGSGSTSTAASLIQALIEDNDIGTVAGGNNSGSRLGGGIVGDFRGEETARVTIHQNVIRNTEVNGIHFIGQTVADGDLHLRITNNIVDSIDDDEGGGLGVIYGIEVTTNAGTSHDVFADIRNNDSASINAQDIRVRQSNAAVTFAIEDFSGNGMLDTSVESFLVTQNPGNTADVRTGGSIVNYTSMNLNNTNTPAPLTPLMAAPGGVEVALSSFEMLSTNVRPKALTQVELDTLVTAAMDRWTATGLTREQISAMRELKFELGDLSGSYLGEAGGNRIVVDRDAGSKGWFVDTTPADDVEFSDRTSSTRRYTNPFTSAAGRMDLLTAIEHEIGHKLGLTDSYAEKDRDSIMYGYLTVGERRTPAATPLPPLAMYDSEKQKQRYYVDRANQDFQDKSTRNVSTGAVNTTTDIVPILEATSRRAATEFWTLAPSGAGNLSQAVYEHFIPTNQRTRKSAETGSQKSKFRSHHPKTEKKEIRSQTSEVRPHHASPKARPSSLKSATRAVAAVTTAPVVNPACGVGTIAICLGTLKAGKTVNIQFKVTINTPFPSGTTEVSNQGSVSFSEAGSPVLTDDPSVNPGTSDETETPVLAQLAVTVNTLGDVADSSVGDGLCDTDVAAGEQCTLRAAIQETNFATTDDVINFSLPVGSTILLDGVNGALPVITGNLVIDGPGANTLTVERSAAANFRIFRIALGQTVTISGLTIANGNDVNGGGIYNDHGNLTVQSVTLRNNTAAGGGGRSDL